MVIVCFSSDRPFGGPLQGRARASPVVRAGKEFESEGANPFNKLTGPYPPCRAHGHCARPFFPFF